MSVPSQSFFSVFFIVYTSFKKTQERYNNLPETEKQRLVEYRKIYEMQKNNWKVAQ